MRVGQTRRRDTGERLIVEALRAIGARVWAISGTGCPDLLVYWQGRFVPLEVKSAHGKLTLAQQDVPWPVVRTVESALRAIGFHPVMAKGQH